MIYSASSASIAHFRSIPSTAALLSSPSYSPIHATRTTSPQADEDAFFSTTLSTPTTISHCITLQRENITSDPVHQRHGHNHTQTPYASPAPPEPEILCLLHLATPGLSGHPSTAHGGAVAAILDEVMGLCCGEHVRSDGRETRGGMFTARLEMQYRAPVSVPATVVARAWVARRERRKLFARGQVVDTEGKVLTEAEGLWVVTERKAIEVGSGIEQGRMEVSKL